MKERLSKLQKWILINCYRKTIEKDNTKLTLLRGYSYRNSELDSLYWTYLFRTEILLDYFKCKPDNEKWTNQKNQHFIGRNNSAQVSTTNTLKNLEKKGLVSWMSAVYSGWQGITLTEKGREISLLLISKPK